MPHPRHRGWVASAANGPHVLEVVEAPEIGHFHEHVWPTQCQSRTPEKPAVVGRRTVLPVDEIAFHLVFPRVRLDICYATEQRTDTSQSAFDVAGRDILQHVRADDQVDVPGETEGT